ncbi:hypothetical protein L1049_010645 [Liquidambar formosana]|uniref:Uncharacterized protein n=1 Tax=Liquidambar formosana TaxID=63359 RepID=A0AAP0N7X3_LIQFO
MADPRRRQRMMKIRHQWRGLRLPYDVGAPSPTSAACSPVRRERERVSDSKREVFVVYKPIMHNDSFQNHYIAVWIGGVLAIAMLTDEEGVRFQSTFLGSAAVAGILPISALQIYDKSGVTVQDVLKENSIETTEENLFQLKYAPESVWGYVEIHIEPGPVLEWVGLPLGVVKGIAGQTRLKICVNKNRSFQQSREKFDPFAVIIL